MTHAGSPFERLVYAPYSRMYWAVFTAMAVTQLNWAAQHALPYDIVMRIGLSLPLSVPIAWVLHFVFSSLVRLAAGKRLARIPELTSAAFTPFILSAPYLAVYLSRWDPPNSAVKIVMTACAIAAGLWILLVTVFGRRSEPAEGTAGWKQFLVSWFGFTIRGTAGLADSLFFPKEIMDPGRPRTILQPLAYPVLLVSCVLMIVYGYAMVATPAQGFLILLSTFLPPILLVNAAHWLAGPRRNMLAVLLGVVSIAYFVFFLYHFSAGTSFDLSLILINRDLLFARDAFKVYASRTDPAVLIAALLLGPVWMFLLQKRFRVFTSQTQSPRSIVHPILFAGIFLLLVATRVPTMDEAVLFGRSLLPDLKERTQIRDVKAALKVPFPYARTNFPLTFDGAPDRSAAKPDVFFVIMESFDRDLVGARTPDGREITPFYNSLIGRGIYPEVFYGSTVQTARGLFVLFTGLYESYKGKAFRDGTRLSLRPLPAIMNDAGYKTVFFNAHDNLNFDNKGPYLRKIGFRKLVAMKGDIVKGVPKDKFWNWGIQDDAFFERSFDWLDRENAAAGGKRSPVFAAFLTLSQHHPHSGIPERRRYLFPHPANRKEQFMNAQYLADLYLREFFRQIDSHPRYKDAIVILTSDHGFPHGTHGNFNEKGFYEESFRIPLLIVWKDHLAPRRITGPAYGQIDIAPTLLDLLGINTANHFIGRSLFAPPVSRPLYMIQPYDGVYLGALDYPWKYVKHISDDREYLFNVAVDPGEKNDLSADPAFAARLAKGRTLMEFIRKNQIVLERNRVWDPRMLR